MIKAKPFATGQAQSQQSPYAGSTPYKKNPAGDFAAYSPQQNTKQFGNTTLNQTYSPGSSPYSQAPQKPTGQTDGNWANYATQDRPAPFTARYGQPDGSFSDSPNYNQRDAFIQALNNQQTPYMTGQRSGPPQYDIGGAWNQASQMVQQGFQNPFAAQVQPRQYPVSPDGLAFEGALPNLAAQAFPSQYQGMAPQQAPQQASQPSRLMLSASQEPAPQPGGRFSPNASQMVAGRVQSTGATGYGFGSGQGGPAPGAIGFTDRPATPVRGGVKQTPLSLADRPSKPADRKSWDAIYAAQNKNNPDGTPKSHYELNKDGAYKGMTEAEAMRKKFVSDSSGSAYNNDPGYRAFIDEKRRERMTPTMWASMQNETVENGVRHKGGFMKRSDIDAQSQWLESRGLTGVPDGSRLDENKLYEDYMSSRGQSIDSLMEADQQARAASQAKRQAAPPTFSEQQSAERAQRAQSQEDIIRQFQRERGFDPRSRMSRPGNRSPIYI